MTTMGPSVRAFRERTSIAELIDLEVQHPDGAPKRGVASVAIDSLLIRFVWLVILLPRHAGTTEDIPALGIRWVSE